MLDHAQLKVIMDKVDLTPIDLILIEDHLWYIGGLQDEYGVTMPTDVDATLMGDIEAIIARLTIEHKKLKDKNKKLDSLKII